MRVKTEQNSTDNAEINKLLTTKIVMMSKPA